MVALCSQVFVLRLGLKREMMFYFGGCKAQGCLRSEEAHSEILQVESRDGTDVPS
jgi:hypothetical protein